MAHFLIVDDDRTAADTLCALVTRRGHEATPAYDGEQGLAVLEDRPIDVVVTDLKMPKVDGLEVIRTIRERRPDVVSIVVTAHGSIESAVEAMRLGAFDFLTKPLDIAELGLKLTKAVAQRELALAMERMSERIRSYEVEDQYRYGMGEIVGTGPAMRRVFDAIEKVAPTDSTVLIFGESGTGKELVARAIHQRSARSEKPFIQVHCAAYAQTLLESELFGHERGAFTGADRRRIGRFELADGGTLFFDEVGEIAPATQIKLLRVLQEREFERVGGTQTIGVDIRLVSATNKDLKRAVTDGSFREDLFYRLNVFAIELPALRDRKEDIPHLVRAFLAREAKRFGRAEWSIDPAVIDALMEYDWPGNVRELQNVIERAAVMADDGEIAPVHLPPILTARRGAYVALPDAAVDFDAELANFERQLIRHAYERSGRVKAQAAKLLGIDRNRLRYKMEKLGIED